MFSFLKRRFSNKNSKSPSTNHSSANDSAENVSKDKTKAKPPHIQYVTQLTDADNIAKSLLRLNSRRDDNEGGMITLAEVEAGVMVEMGDVVGMEAVEAEEEEMEGLSYASSDFESNIHTIFETPQDLTECEVLEEHAQTP